MLLACVQTDVTFGAVDPNLRRGRDRLFDAAVTLGPDGPLTVYRKTHLPQLG